MRIKGKGKSILTRQRLPVLGLFEGLLDQVPGAAAAYSIRLLRADYSGGLVRVRAYDGSSDQGEADVLPDKNNEISLSSSLTNLDSTANGRGVSTLGELVDDGGANYDGFVSEWKDQSPNANHATNTTASEQPQLVDAGNLVKLNNKPALKFDGSDDELEISRVSDIPQPYTQILVFKLIDDSNNQILQNVPNFNSPRSLIDIDQSEYRIFSGKIFKPFNVNKDHSIVYVLSNGANSEAILNNQGTITGDTGNGGLNKNLLIGGGSNTALNFYFQESLYYPDNQSNNKSKLVSLENDFYNAF